MPLLRPLSGPPLQQRADRAPDGGLDYDDLAPRHLDLLDSLAAKPASVDVLSYRQAEWLLDIRDEVQTATAYRGFSVSYLLQTCLENRIELDDDGTEWVVELRDSGRTSVRKHEARRLYRMAGVVGGMEEWAA